MRKLLLSLFAVMTASVVSAQKVTLDLTNAAEEWGMADYTSKSKGNDATSFSNGTYEIVLQGDGSNGFAAYSGYVLFGKQGASLTLPAFDFAVGKIVVEGNTGASNATITNIYVGETAASDACKGCVETNTFDISENYQAAGNVYTLKIDSKHNAQVTKIHVYEVGDNDTPETPEVVEGAITVQEALAAAAGTVATVQGVVMAVNTKGAVIGDNTGVINFYNNGETGLAVGDQITITGTLAVYQQFNQFPAGSTFEKTGTTTVKYPTPTVMDGAALDAWIATPEIDYVQYTGKLSVSGNYRNVIVDGAETAQGSLAYTPDALLADITNGSTITVKGYAMYCSGSKYVNTVVTEIVAGEIAETTDITNTLETAYSVSKCIELIDAGKGLEQKVYLKGIVSAPYKDMFIDVNYGNATFFISEDGTTEAPQFEIYRAYDQDGNKFTQDDLIGLGDEVIVYACLTKYGSTYETAQGGQILQINSSIPNAISSIEAEKQDAVIYDIAGRRVQKAVKGLYIVNGKKVVK